MAVQSRSNISNVEFLRGGWFISRDTQTLLKDATRSGDIVSGTVMCRIAASGKWETFTGSTATTGVAVPKGIYVGPDITEAAIQAADVTGLSIVVGGGAGLYDQDDITIENSKTLDTVVTVGTTDLATVEEWLRRIGLFATSGVAIDGYENS